MSADWDDGMDGEFKVENRQFTLTKDSRIYFDASQFPELISGIRENGGIYFSGTIAADINGYVMRDVINGKIVGADGYATTLDGGLSGAVSWEQGRSKEYFVQGFIEDFGDGCFVIHPEVISQ